jgi:hypothetical protein
MDIDKSERGVFHVESNRHWSFVSSHAWEASFDFKLTNVLYRILNMWLGKHNNIAAHHYLLNERIIDDALTIFVEWIHDNGFPELGSLLILSFSNLLSIQLHHLLEANNVDVWHLLAFVFLVEKDVRHIKVIMGRSISSTIPSDDRELEITLFSVNMFMLL